MRTLLFLLEKEFRQVFRDPAVMRMMFIMPIMQLIVLPMAADYEIKNIWVTVIDHDKSSYSNGLVEKISSSGYFKFNREVNSFDEALEDVEHDKSDIILEIPDGFEKQVIKEESSNVFMAVNAINGVRANLGASYLSSIIRIYNDDIRTRLIQFPRKNLESRISTTSSNWYNVHMNYRLFMVPGILVILLTMVGSILAALNIVKEKEIGTIEQINVTPIRKHHFILGKLIPFWLMGQFVLTIGLIIARIVYGVVPVGNIGLIYLFSSVYLFAILGLGLLISSYVNNQQQAMLISFFLMMVFILLGGLYTSIESMPVWAQYITKFNPVSYFIDVMRMVVLKGSSIADIGKHLIVILIFALILNGWAVLSYRKRN